MSAVYLSVNCSIGSNLERCAVIKDFCVSNYCNVLVMLEKGIENVWSFLSWSKIIGIVLVELFRRVLEDRFWDLKFFASFGTRFERLYDRLRDKFGEWEWFLCLWKIFQILDSFLIFANL